MTAQRAWRSLTGRRRPPRSRSPAGRRKRIDDRQGRRRLWRGQDTVTRGAESTDEARIGDVAVEPRHVAEIGADQPAVRIERDLPRYERETGAHGDLRGTRDAQRVPASYRSLIAGGWVHYFDFTYGMRHFKAEPLSFGSLQSRVWQVLAYIDSVREYGKKP